MGRAATLDARREDSSLASNSWLPGASPRDAVSSLRRARARSGSAMGDDDEGGCNEVLALGDDIGCVERREEREEEVVKQSSVRELMWL